MFLSSWSDRQILLCPPCERGGGGDRKCAEDTQWLQCGNDGTLCGCSRGRAEAKWLAPVFAAVSQPVGDIDDAEEKGWWGVHVCVPRRCCGCDIIYPRLQWSFPVLWVQSPQQVEFSLHMHALTHTLVKMTVRVLQVLIHIRSFWAGKTALLSFHHTYIVL